MRHSGCFFTVLFSLVAAIGCKQESGAAAKTNTSNEPGAAPQTEQPKGEAYEMKMTLQGKWKAIAEPGVVYEIKGDELQRFFQNKAEPKVHLTYSTACATACGVVGKAYEHTGTVGCLTFSAEHETCFWVISYAHDQFDFVRMGSPDAKPESWIKM